MLLDVITRVSSDTGLHLTQQRNLLVDLANRAALEMHKMLECNKIFRECTLTVPIDAVVSLPAYIGELRGMRMHTNDLPFDLNSMAAPRYVNTTWAYKFKNWRDLGESAIHTAMTGTGPITLVPSVIEIVPAVVSITGQTDIADRVEEKLTLSSFATNIIFNRTANIFGPRIDTIACFTKRTGDITVYDSSNTEIAVLYNHQNKTRYKKVDVSKLFWSIDVSDTDKGQSLIDVLYKMPYTRLTNDSDSFPGGDDFNEAWYYFTMATYFSPMKDRASDAGSQRQAAMAAMLAAKDSGESDIIKKVSFGRNKFFSLFKRNVYYPNAQSNTADNTVL
jgi:hypothetical protein